MSPISATRFGRLLVLGASFLVAACSGPSTDVNGGTDLDYNGSRYTGVVIPGLQIEDADTRELGLPERSDLGADRPVLSLAGVDPALVTAVEGLPDDETPWTLFVRDGLIGQGRNLFDVVPAMCRYAPPAQAECP